jgi:phosphate transport system substrate-binding protein
MPSWPAMSRLKPPAVHTTTEDNKMKSAIAFAGLASLLAATAPVPTIQIDGAGATLPYPIYSKWFSEYNKVHPDVQIKYQPIGSGDGIRQLTDQTVFFGASDGPMSDEQIKAAPGGVLHLPTVLGALVPVYNIPGVSVLGLELQRGGLGHVGHTALKFSGPTLADIYLGKITKWNDKTIATENPGVHLPASDIAVVHRSDGSGSTYIFADYLAKVSPQWKAKVGVATSVNWPVGVGGKGNEGVSTLVTQIRTPSATSS